jgi:hypothetical protein
MNTQNSLYKDLTTSVLVLAGVFGFMSGEFVLSTLFFGTASLTSNLPAIPGE